MRLAVLGASGGLGAEVAMRAVNRGYDVNAIALHEERIPISDPRLRLFGADVTDAQQLIEVMSGCDGVVSAIGSRQRGGEVRVYSDGMAATLSAMRELGIVRLVCASAAGVGDDGVRILPLFFRSVVIPLFARAEYADMERMEGLVESSHTQWTIVKPLWLRDGEPGHAIHVSETPQASRHWRISRSSVAEVMLDAVDERRWIHKRIWVSP